MNFTGQIENFISNIRKKLTPSQVAAFLSCIVVGFVAHGYVFFNRLSYHDNSASLFSLGATYESGRWFLGIIYKLQLLTTKSYSVPVFNGIVSMLLIGATAMLIIDMFQVKSKFAGAVIGALMVAYPVVTSIFSFMFTSWPYFLAMLLSVVAARVVIEKGGVSGIIIGAIVLAFSLGIYQAFFAVTISILLIKLLMDVINGQITSVAEYAKSGFSYLITLGAGLGLWAVLRKVFMAIKHIEAVDYKGMDEAFSLAKLPARFAVAARAFFGFGFEGINSFRYLRLCTMLIFVVALIHIVVLVIKKESSVAVKLCSVVGLVLLPIGMNVVYFLSTSSEYQVDTLMLYGDIFVIILPIMLIEIMENTELVENLATKAIRLFTWIELLAIVVVTVGYVYLDNAAYLKADLIQEEAVAYFTELATSIKLTPGFDDDMDIVLVGWDELSDETLVNVSPLEQLDGIQLEKYPTLEELVTYSGSIHFMREHIGFGNDKVTVDDGTVASETEVKSMPCYPDDGAIAVIDNRVIVKMGQ